MKRLKAKEIRRYHGSRKTTKLYIQQVIQLLTDGALPQPTTKKVADALKKEIEPLRSWAFCAATSLTVISKPTRAAADRPRAHPA